MYKRPISEVICEGCNKTFQKENREMKRTQRKEFLRAITEVKPERSQECPAKTTEL